MVPRNLHIVRVKYQETFSKLPKIHGFYRSEKDLMWLKQSQTIQITILIGIQWVVHCIVLLKYSERWDFLTGPGEDPRALLGLWRCAWSTELGKIWRCPMGGTPSHHPFKNRDFPWTKQHPALGVASFQESLKSGHDCLLDITKKRVWFKHW